MIRPLAHAHCDFPGCNRYILVTVSREPVSPREGDPPGHDIQFPVSSVGWTEGSGGAVWCPVHGPIEEKK